MDQTRILVVDDDETFRRLTIGELEQRSFSATPARNVAEAIAVLKREEFDLILLDLHLGDGDGLEVLHHVQSEHPRVEVVILTGHGDIDTAIDAMRNGAFDYLRKPCPVDELEVTLIKARERQELIERNAILQGGLAPPDRGAEFVGASPEFHDVKNMIDRVGPTDTAVLILGETGVGKDVVAKLIHSRSERRDQPLVVVECAALHEDLLHSELFGHERGAFTGATQAKHGLFEVAHKGTIFLDEIGDVSPQTQVKLLRVLETGRFRRVGGTREIEVDVRILAATNRDLTSMMEKGYFRKDLYYRLSTICIEVTPLRERPADIPILIEHFLRRLNSRFGQNRSISEKAMSKLCAHRWTGNVRELMHVVERTVILSQSPVIDEDQLPSEVRSAGVESAALLMSLEEVESAHILRVLDAVKGNRIQAATYLGISERTLYRRIKELGLDRGINIGDTDP